MFHVKQWRIGGGDEKSDRKNERRQAAALQDMLQVTLCFVGATIGRLFCKPSNSRYDLGALPLSLGKGGRKLSEKGGENFKQGAAILPKLRGSLRYSL